MDEQHRCGVSAVTRTRFWRTSPPLGPLSDSGLQVRHPLDTAYANRRRFITGLDLGQARDFTAIAVLERTNVPPIDPPLKAEDHYAVRHLE